MSEEQKLLHSLIEVLAARLAAIQMLVESSLRDSDNWEYQSDIRQCIERWNELQDELKALMDPDP